MSDQVTIVIRPSVGLQQAIRDACKRFEGSPNNERVRASIAHTVRLVTRKHTTADGFGFFDVEVVDGKRESEPYEIPITMTRDEFEKGGG